MTSNPDLKWLKKGVWVYFYLLIFEGALRKWFLPGLSDVILIIRDPLALVLIFYAWKLGYLKSNNYVLAMVVIAVIGIATALLIGHQSIPVTLYGGRILLIQFPFLFVVGAIFNKDDVATLGKHILWIAIPMTILIALQFYSPQSALVNRGVGGNLEGSGFYGGAMGYFRPSGTFSFTNGNTFYYHLLACFIFYFWVEQKTINKILLVTATICLLIAIPLSISRTLFFSVIIGLIFYFIAMASKPKFLKTLFFFLVSSVIIVLTLSKLEFVKTATDAFSHRFESANETEGGLEGTLIDRYLGGFVDAVSNSKEIPFFGYGIGMGTNAGSQLLSGDRIFLIAEEEWARTIGEMGLLLGLGIILIRLLIVWDLTVKSYKFLRDKSYISWMLLSFVLLIFPQGQWGQPTALGFAIFSTGLVLATFNLKNTDTA